MKEHYNEPLGVYSPHALYCICTLCPPAIFYAKFRQHFQNNAHIGTGNNRIKNNYKKIPESTVIYTVSINAKAWSSAGTEQLGALP
jgi:hypothetical protein